MDKNRLRHYQRAYRALVKEVGLSEDDRRAFNLDLTGHHSSSEFTEQDWCNVIARLQELNGQDAEPGRPRLKLPRLECEDDAERAFLSEGMGYDFASDAQIRFIRQLAGRVEWRTPNGLELLIRKRVIKSETRNQVWRGELPMLTNEEAGLTIRILLRMTGEQQTGHRRARAGGRA